MGATSEQLSELRQAVTSRANAFARLLTLTEALVAFHRELALLLALEKEEKLRAWEGSLENSVSARDRVADLSALTTSTQLITTRGEIAALTEERDYLKLLLGQPEGMP